SPPPQVFLHSSIQGLDAKHGIWSGRLSGLGLVLNKGGGPQPGTRLTVVGRAGSFNAALLLQQLQRAADQPPPRPARTAPAPAAARQKRGPASEAAGIASAAAAAEAAPCGWAASARVRLVSEEWLVACVRAQRLLEPAPYEVQAEGGEAGKPPQPPPLQQQHHQQQQVPLQHQQKQHKQQKEQQPQQAPRQGGCAGDQQPCPPLERSYKRLRAGHHDSAIRLPPATSAAAAAANEATIASFIACTAAPCPGAAFFAVQRRAQPGPPPVEPTPAQGGPPQPLPQQPQPQQPQQPQQPSQPPLMRSAKASARVAQALQMAQKGQRPVPYRPWVLPRLGDGSPVLVGAEAQPLGWWDPASRSYVPLPDDSGRPRAGWGQGPVAQGERGAVAQQPQPQPQFLPLPQRAAGPQLGGAAAASGSAAGAAAGAAAAPAGPCGAGSGAGREGARPRTSVRVVSYNCLSSTCCTYMYGRTGKGGGAFNIPKELKPYRLWRYRGFRLWQWEYEAQKRGRGSSVASGEVHYGGSLWERRQEIVAYDADVVCLQEVDHSHYLRHFQPLAQAAGYSTLYLPRGRGPFRSACATLHATSTTPHELTRCAGVRVFCGPPLPPPAFARWGKKRQNNV
ncbi:hypothetical protein TSOC_013773, partial [Tetrabaena socialis]